MVSAAMVAIAMAVTTPTAAPAAEAADRAVKEALGRGGYPWYDAGEDAFRPVRPPPIATKPSPSGGRPRTGFGALMLADVFQFLVFLLLTAGLFALVFFLARSWRRYLENEPLLGPSRGPARVEGQAGPLPAGLAADEADPLGAARRLRAAGRRGEAVVLLFTYLMRTLAGAGLVRLAPGKTGRQLVRSVADAELRGLAEPSLRLFEAVYYGHREPEPEPFEAAWATAEELAGRVEGVAGASR